MGLQCLGAMLWKLDKWTDGQVGRVNGRLLRRLGFRKDRM